VSTNANLTPFCVRAYWHLSCSRWGVVVVGDRPVMQRKNPKLLGVSASLRNARWGAGSRVLIESLNLLQTKEALLDFLREQSEMHLENFVQSGRKEGKAFSEIYDNLKKLSGDRGLSNSEVALSAALWAAHRFGVDIEHLSLCNHFTPNGDVKHKEELAKKLLDADGLLVSGPVYFGDRGSLAENLLHFIADNSELRQALSQKVYGGIAVGAKRNGGQETTLIYQMIDMLNLGYLAVGNDSDTTAQYGGTGIAGDVGAMIKDTYGLETCMGIGRRLGHVLNLLHDEHEIKDEPKVLFLILQDAGGIAKKTVGQLVERVGSGATINVVDVTDNDVKPCIACDICPTHIGPDDEYRCIITSKNDALTRMHDQLLRHDMIVPVVVETKDRSKVTTVYQKFIERTRYLRRGDYVFSDLLVAPLVIEELGANCTLGMRIMTSFIRHHTVLTRPMVAHIVKGEMLDFDEVVQEMKEALARSKKLIAGRLAHAETESIRKYNPVGYVLSADKDKEDQRMDKRREMVDSRSERLKAEATLRLINVVAEGK